jgi:hypothetical protein
LYKISVGADGDPPVIHTIRLRFGGTIAIVPYDDYLIIVQINVN